MKVWRVAFLVLIVGCAGAKGKPIEQNASWVFEETEFEAFYFDMFEDYPVRTLSTKEIGQHSAGTNILLRKKFSGDDATKILQLLKESEARKFWTEPVDLANMDLAVLRFERNGETVDIGIDPNAEYVTVYVDGEFVGSEIYKTPATELTEALKPFLDLKYLSGELEMKLDSEKAGVGYRLSVTVKNGTDDTVRLPPVEEMYLFIEFRDKDREMVYAHPIFDLAVLELDQFVSLKSGYSEYVWIDIPPERLNGTPVEVRAFYSAFFDGKNKFELYSDWVPVN